MHICNVHIVAQFVCAGGQEEYHIKTAMSYTVDYQYSFLRSIKFRYQEGKVGQQNQNTSVR
jgi:hypothetical protein